MATNVPPHNLREVIDATVRVIQNPDIGIASLENICMYLWGLFKVRFPGLDEVELKRGFPGTTEGCIYRGERHAAAAIGLAA